MKIAGTANSDDIKEMIIMNHFFLVKNDNIIGTIQNTM